MATVVDVQEERLLIGGEWTFERRGAVRRDQSGDGRRRRDRAERDRRDVSAAIDAAATALDEWRAMPAIQRARILRGRPS